MFYEGLLQDPFFVSFTEELVAPAEIFQMLEALEAPPCAKDLY